MQKNDFQTEYSIVIRTYNEEEHIGKLLTGILQQTMQPKEIIIVDSGSTDATISIAAQFSASIMHIDKGEFSFGRALNIGVEQTTAPFVVIASAHVYPVYRNWIEQLLLPFDDPTVGIVYGGQCGDAETHYSEICIMKYWFPSKAPVKQDHTFCNNANAAIRRALWEQCPYNEYLSGLEDVAFAKEVAVKGYRVAYTEKAQIVHVHRQTIKQIYVRYYREALALKTIYPHERIGKGESFFLLLLNVWSDFLHAWNDKVLHKKALGIILFRFAQFLGTYRGFYDGTVNLKELKEHFYYPKSIQKQQSDHVQCQDLEEIDYANIHRDL